MSTGLTFAKVRAAIVNVKKRGGCPSKIKLSPLDHRDFGKVCKAMGIRTYRADVKHDEFHGLRIVADDRVPNGEIWIV